MLDSILQKLKEFNLGLPNIPDSDVPDGNSEKDNKETVSYTHLTLPTNREV